MRKNILPCITILLFAASAQATIVVDNWNMKFSQLAMVNPENEYTKDFSIPAIDRADMLEYVSAENPGTIDGTETGIFLDSLSGDAFNSVYGFPEGLDMPATQAVSASGEEFDPCMGVLPEPTSLAIWGLLGAGCAGGAMASRRRNRRAPWSEETRQSIHKIIERGRISV